MNWKHFLTRIALVAVAFPILGALVFLLPQESHLGFAIIATLVSTVGALEVVGLFRAKKIHTSVVLAPILAATLPIAAWLETRGILPAGVHGLWPAVALAVLFAWAVLVQSGRSLPGLLAFVSSSAVSLLYPALSLSFIVRMAGLPQPSLSIAFFLCMVFGNDMAAYFAGSMWGRSTCLHLPVSPQKSAVGFAAGIAGSFLVVFAFRLAVPGFLGLGVGASIALALVVGAAVILGDLVESGLKRSAGVKDSGVAIPGRGGVLDSVDSMVLAAPLFYGLLVLTAR